MTTTPLAWWIGFHGVAGTLLLADLSGLRHDPCTSLHKALRWAFAWVTFAIVLGVLLYFNFGRDIAAQFAGGYLLEQTLSVDNLFLFLVIFQAFQVPPEQQHRVLTWGVLGAIVLRAGFVIGGLRLLSHFQAVTYVFGGIVTSASPPWLRWVLRHLSTDTGNSGSQFFVRTPLGLRIAPLFLVLIAIEVTDVVFAMDSIPAVLSISRHTFVVYTSNILAVLSLRSLFPAVVEGLRRFWMLHWGVALILIFVGGKMLLSNRISPSPLQSLAVIATVLLASVVGSLLRPANTLQT
jgi:tellurite resistance protein TerC